MREKAQMKMREDLLLGDLAGILIDGRVVHFAGVLQDFHGFDCHARV